MSGVPLPGRLAEVRMAGESYFDRSWKPGDITLAASRAA
jgi:hypothetical protein